MAVGLLAIVGCTKPPTQQLPSSQKIPEAETALEQRLFVHLLAPPSYTQPSPAHRIVSARIHPSEYFAVSIGDPDNPFTNRWDGALTVPQWSKAAAPEARPLEPFWNSGEAILAGRVDRVNGELIAQLQGRFHTTLNYFHGHMELEKPVYAQGCLFHNDGVWSVWFVLSGNPDCSDFLRALDNDTVHLPVVDRDSDAAKQWVGHQSSGTLQILDAEPSAPMDAGASHE